LPVEAEEVDKVIDYASMSYFSNCDEGLYSVKSKALPHIPASYCAIGLAV